MRRRDVLSGAAALAAASTLAPRAARADRLPLGNLPGTRYPDPRVESLDKRFAAKVGNAAIERIATGFRWAEGPVYFRDGGYLVWSDIPNNRMMRWLEEDGHVSVFRTPSNYSNGNTRDREGRLISCEHDARRVTRTEHDGSITVLIDRFDGKPLNAPNDVVVASDGAVWFTDPGYGIDGNYEGHRASAELPRRVYRLDPGSGRASVATEGLDRPNGLAFSPDETRLYVAETGDPSQPDPVRHIRVFDVAPDGRSLSGGAVFHTVTPGYSDGFRVDEDGNLWSSAADGVHCLSPEGALMGILHVPHRVSNLTFGGPFKNRLFICGSGTLYAIFLNRRGVQWP